MKTLIILPSYNEAENIVELISEINSLGNNYDICVVDDNSPDGTAKFVELYIKEQGIKNVHLMVREGKSGRGDAVRAGMNFGLNSPNNYEYYVEMDCDFSHHPKYLNEGIENLKNAEVVLGSRYPDGAIKGWPLLRKVLSFCSNLLIRTLLSSKISDYTNGFRFYTRKSAELLCSIPQEHKGYIYLSETLAVFLKNEFKIKSFPIVFVNRERGKSNTTFAEIKSSLIAIFKIAYCYNFENKYKKG